MKYKPTKTNFKNHCFLSFCTSCFIHIFFLKPTKPNFKNNPFQNPNIQIYFFLSLYAKLYLTFNGFEEVSNHQTHPNHHSPFNLCELSLSHRRHYSLKAIHHSLPIRVCTTMCIFYCLKPISRFF